jgi:hypothetical protein
VGIFSYKLDRLLLTQHSFSVTLFTLGFRLFFILLQINLVLHGCLQFKIDTLGDHLCTCTAHSGAKKAHDWVVGQLPDLFRPTHTAKTQQVVRRRGQYCGDVEIVGYLANAVGPVPLVLDTLNGTLHYPKAVVDKIRKYRTDYNNNPPNVISFMPAIASTSGRLHSEFRLSGMSGLSAFLRKTAFKLILICPKYSDTSLCPH